MAFKQVSYFLFLLLIAAEFRESFQLYSHKVEAPDKTYFIEKFFRTNWYKANQFCEFHGMELMSMNSVKEHQILKEGLKKVGDKINFWTSGNDLADENSWFWASNGLPFGDLNFWGSGEPRQKSRKEDHCIQLFGEIGNFSWSVEDCGSERFFICENVKKGITNK